MSAPARAQSSSIKALTPFEMEQERLKKLLDEQPAAYIDNVMDASALAALPEEQPHKGQATQIGYQGLSLEARYDYESHGHDGGSSAMQQGFSRFGVRAEYSIETLNYGRVTLQGDFRKNVSDRVDPGLGWYGRADQIQGRRIALRNDGFPVTARTFADIVAGDTYSDLTDGVRRSYRMALGSSTVRGGGLRLYNSNVDIRLGSGRRGTLVGGPYPGYEPLPGRLDWAGLTWRLPHNMYLAWQTSHGAGVPVYDWYNNSTSSSMQPMLANTRSHVWALGYGSEAGFLQNDGFTWRLMRMNSNLTDNSTATSLKAQGTFVEASLHKNNYIHHAGAYQASPDLVFGDQQLPSDNKGAYWRTDYNGTRWNWGIGSDVEYSNPRHDQSRPYGKRTNWSGNVRRRIDGNTSVGANATWGNYRSEYAGNEALSLSGNRTFLASAYMDRRFPSWGQSRLTVTTQRNNPLVRNAPAATGWDIQWEHDWITGKYETMRPEFTTTLGWAEDHSTPSSQRYPTAGLRFRYWPDARWNLGGSLMYSSRSGNLYSSRGFSGALSVDGDLGGGWHLGATASANRAVMNFSSPVVWNGMAPLASRTRDRMLSVYLRWEGSRGGAPYAVAGAHMGSTGAGSIEGVVYYDSNRDGMRQATEMGVAGVEVVLDGSARAVTDSRGHYRFALVATGKHTLTPNLDTVPLPWGTPPAASKVSADVNLRQSAYADMGLVRLGE